MDTPNPSNWSNLPNDILTSLFERLSFVDFNRAKMVCSNWYIGAKSSIPPCKIESPWLSLFLHDGSHVLYNPDEDKVYKSLTDFSRSRFIANYGNWFLMLDSESHLLYIKDIFSEIKIDLPPLESIISSRITLKRWEDDSYKALEYLTDAHCFLSINDLRGRLWIDEKTKEFVVVWYFNGQASYCYLHLCKKGDDHYTRIPNSQYIFESSRGLSDMVLCGYILYIYTIHRRRVRIIDLSRKQGFKVLTPSRYQLLFSPFEYNNNIAVKLSREVLLVESTIFEGQRRFRLYKTMDPNADPYEYIYNPNLVEVESLGDEALLLDLGLTVHANNNIKPNSIYCTRRRAGLSLDFDIDICVFNLATNEIKRFPSLANMNIKDAQWFLHMT